MSSILYKLHYYHIWTESAPDIKYPTCCIKSMDKWNGKTKDGDQWFFDRMSDIEVEFVFKNLGTYGNAQYPFTIKLYSMDTTKHYIDLNELQEDMYIKILAGI